MFNFDAFADLTDSFNLAVEGVVGVASPAVAAGLMFSAVEGTKEKKNVHHLRPPSPFARMF